MLGWAGKAGSAAGTFEIGLPSAPILPSPLCFHPAGGAGGGQDGECGSPRSSSIEYLCCIRRVQQSMLGSLRQLHRLFGRRGKQLLVLAEPSGVKQRVAS